jgi:putative ABC transport system permease protein
VVDPAGPSDPALTRGALPHTSSVGGGVALLARGIWWRRGASLVLLLCASITVAGAAAGPVWGRAAQASLLARTLADARVGERAWIVTGATDANPGLSFTVPTPAQVESDLRIEGRLPAGLDELFDRPTGTATTGRRLQVVPVRAGDARSGLPAKPPLGTLLARTDSCRHVRLVSGRCPVRRADLLLSDRSARELGVRAGDRVQLPELSGELPLPGRRPSAVFSVAGVYRAEAVRTGDRFWFDSPDFDYAPAAQLGGETIPASLDAILVRPDLVQSLRTVPVRVQQEQALRPGVITLANADRVAGQLDAAVAELAEVSHTVAGSAPAARTLAGSQPGRKLVAGTATFVSLQVVVFGWVVVLGLVAASVAARDGELALAKLRGLRGRRLAVHALTEPVVLVLAAVPLGLLGAWVTLGVLARRVLLPGTPLVVPSGVWWVVAATVGGAILACGLAAVRSLRTPVAAQLRRGGSSSSSGSGSGSAASIAAAVLLTLAAVGLVLVLTLGRAAPAALPALLTPVVVALAAGLVVGRAVQILLRLAVGRTRRWSLGPYLAVRQLARQASLTQVTALVTVATAVSAFAAGAYVVTADQREAQARLDVGAERVVHVAPAKTVDLLAATRQVDPGGRWAMAAIQRRVGANPLLAVDSYRFDAAFAIPGGALAGPGGLGELVPTRIPQPLVVRGDTATIQVARSFLYSRNRITIGLQLRFVTAAGDAGAAILGELDPRGSGPRTLTGRLPGCRPGCTVAGVYLVRRAGVGEITGSVELESLRVGALSYEFAEADWRPGRVEEAVPDSSSTSTLEPREGTRDGVVVRFTASPSIVPGIVRVDVPTELPAVVGDRTSLSPIGTRHLVGGSDLGGGEVPFVIAGRTPVLPRTGTGSLVDLELVSRFGPARGNDVDHQVWLGRSAPADAPARLAAAGLTVREVESRADRRDRLDRAEPARAQLLLLGAGAAVLLAGVAGVATVLAAAARRRAVEAAALHAMAVPGRVVRGSAVLEDVALLLPGVITGAACAAYLVTVLAPVLAEVTGAATEVSGRPDPLDVLLPVVASALVTALLLVPVVLGVTRPARAETPLRVAT